MVHKLRQSKFETISEVDLEQFFIWALSFFSIRILTKAINKKSETAFFTIVTEDDVEKLFELHKSI